MVLYFKKYDLVLFDKEGWFKCGFFVEYLKGFYRNNKKNNDLIFLFEEGRCCKVFLFN